MKSDNNMNKVPRNPNMQMSEDEINELLKLADEQVKSVAANNTIRMPGKDELKAEQKRQEEQKKLEEQKKQEAIRKKEAQKKLEEQNKQEALKKKAEQKRLEEQKKQEALKKKEEKKKLEEQEEAMLQKKAKERELEAKRRAEEFKKQNNTTEVKKASYKEITNEPTSVVQAEPKKEKKSKKNKSIVDEEIIFIEDDLDLPKKNTFGRVFGNVLEFFWTIFKLAVVISVITTIVGVLLSRDMMIRGRSGDRLSVEASSSSVLSTEKNTKTEAFKWVASIDPEKITLEADDGKIMVASKIYAKDKGNRWAVVLHGWNETMEDVYDIAKCYNEKGYNVLIPDLRGNGESEGSFYGMGWLERIDVINWMDVIIEENPSAQIVVHGVDLGADAALMLSGDPLKSNIKAVVAEGAYTSGWDVMKKEFKLRHEKLPTFPVLYMLNPVLKVWAGYSLMEADAVSQVKNTRIPVLLIRGSDDSYADQDMTDQLDQSIASKHKVVTINGGKHGDCRFVNDTTYYDATFDFLSSNE